VVALGGGTVEDLRTRAVLRNARVVYPRVSYDEAMSRIRGGRFRPLLSRPDLDKVYKRRLPIYQDVSVFTINTCGRRPDPIALEVLAELTRLPLTPPKALAPIFAPGSRPRPTEGAPAEDLRSASLCKHFVPRLAADG
jgi:3-dehydroquinate synthase/shikimate kinase/3-dehydroquinate synthase